MGIFLEEVVWKLCYSSLPQASYAVFFLTSLPMSMDEISTTLFAYQQAAARGVSSKISARLVQPISTSFSHV